MLALIVPLSFGRGYGWPAWVWPCFAACALATAAFVAHEQRIRERGGYPLFDLELFRLPGVAAGVIAVLLIMSCYAGFLLSLTLRLQSGLGFSPLHAGLTFALYASGFAIASLTWTGARSDLRERLPILGPLVMGTALLAVGLTAADGSWSLAFTTPLLFAGGVGHAWGFSPLANQLAAVVRESQTADLSGLILTASLIGQVVGVAAFVGVYLSLAPHDSAHALAITTAALAGALAATAACAFWAVSPRRANAAALCERRAGT
jgi:hypothetical protein